MKQIQINLSEKEIDLTIENLDYVLEQISCPDYFESLESLINKFKSFKDIE